MPRTQFCYAVISRKSVHRCVEIRCLHGAVVPSVGCSSMDPGQNTVTAVAWTVLSLAIGGCRKHGMLPGWYFGCSVVDETKQH